MYWINHIPRVSSGIRKDHALSRRFQKVDVNEPSINETIEILRGLKGKFEDFHHVEYEDKALVAAVELSAKFINDRFLPDKAIDVIDEAGAQRRLKAEVDGSMISVENIEDIVSKLHVFHRKLYLKMIRLYLKT